MAKDYNPSRRNREAFEALAETPGNVPPQAVELEEAVLGALMLEKDSIIAVQEYVTPDAFYTEEHRTIYKAIEELSMELKPIDLYTVTERLKGKKELKKVGGASYLAQLTQKVGSAANVEFHAKIIAQKYVQRELIRSATEIQKRSYDESTDVTELIGYAEGEIFKVAEGHVKRSVQVSKDILARALMQIEEASKNTSAFNGVPSGFMAIDRVTLGWQLSDLIIIAARPSMGKTAFVLSMARNMAVDHEQGVAFFSLEMSSVQLMMRLIIAETGLNGNDVKSGRLTPEQWRHLESATKPLGAAPLFIDDTPALSVFEFRSKARRLKIHNDIKIIIIDYLQLMTGNQDSKGNREQEVAFISRTLKAIAKELKAENLTEAHIVVAAGLPLTWTSGQKADFRAYLMKNAEVEFVYKKTAYHIYIDDVRIYPQGYAAIASFATALKGVNLIADIGNGTMNTLYMINGKPQQGKMFTEKFGTYQCTLAVREAFMQKTQREINDAIIDEVLNSRCRGAEFGKRADYIRYDFGADARPRRVVEYQVAFIVLTIGTNRRNTRFVAFRPSGYYFPGFAIAVCMA